MQDQGINKNRTSQAGNKKHEAQTETSETDKKNSNERCTCKLRLMQAVDLHITPQTRGHTSNQLRVG